MNRSLSTAFIFAIVATVTSAGCNKKTDDTANLKSAIDNYYAAHPFCIFKTPQKFPAQADTKDDSDTAGFDALTDQGLLVRTTAEKKKMIILTKQVNNYDLSDKGRSAWTVDPSQPGYGNFCYAHRKVQNIVSNTPAGSTQPGATTTVNYTYTLDGVAEYARAAEVQTAFPGIKAQLDSASSGQNTLVLGSNGWAVQGGQ